MKDLHPVDTSEYVMAKEIDHDPVFNCWVNLVLMKRLGIIPLAKKRNNFCLKKTQVWD